MYLLFLNKEVKILIGSAGVSIAPMAARGYQRVGQQVDATGPNVARVVGAATAAGLLSSILSEGGR